MLFRVKHALQFCCILSCFAVFGYTFYPSAQDLIDTNPAANMNMPSEDDHLSESHNDGSMDNGMMMHMTFYFGVHNVPLLFEAWTINSRGGMAGACIAVCLVALFYEGLKVLRERLLRRSQTHLNPRSEYESESENVLVQEGLPARLAMFSSSHYLQTFLHLVQVSVSYALMLVFMTYNAYLAISVIIGAGLGYFLFGWKKAVIVDVNEHCH